MKEPRQIETPPHPSEDERSAMARAMGIAHELIAISLEMSLIPLGGYWLDQRFDKGPLFLLLGCLVGFSIGFYHLMRFASSMKQKDKDDKDKD